MSLCERLKAHLVLNGLDAVRAHEEFATHLDRCPTCAAVIAAYADMPELLAELPEHEPDEALVAKTLASASAEPARPPVAGRRRRIAGGLAAALVAVAALGLFREIAKEWPLAPPPPSQPMTAPEDGDAVAVDKVSMQSTWEEDKQVAGLESQDSVVAMELKAGRGGEDIAAELEPEGFDFDRSRVGDREIVEKKKANRPTPKKPVSDLRSKPEYDAGAAVREWAEAEPNLAEELGNQEAEPEVFKRDAPLADRQSVGAAQGAPDEDSGSAVLTENESERGRRAADLRREVANRRADLRAETQTRANQQRIQTEAPASGEGRLSARDELPRGSGIDTAGGFVAGAPDSTNEPIEQSSVGGKTQPSTEFGAYRQKDPARTSPPPPSAAARFLAEYQRTEDLSFQEATGYWASTYVPGDPVIRLLNARLQHWDRSALAGAEDLEADVAPVRQPFDPPTAGALGLSVMADANAVEGPTRMRLQVGVQAIEHRRGQRPAMNVGVVVDLPPEANDDRRIAVRALLDALLKSRQAGDRFSLIATRGGLRVPADEFRFGPLEVAKRALLDPEAESGAEPIALDEALELAAAAVRAGEDSSRPLGSSSILLITAAKLPEGAALNALVDRIHGYAAAGVTLSVVPLGAGSDASTVDALVLAGLGHRRILETPDRARALIEDELSAASRAVARAARLSIRLAPGVHLIDVLGSERLDEPAADRVREIEKSMDLRLSSNLGIDADRGEDEDGIQIVIPSVYAGDSLTVLLDVLVERPGPVAEVSLRYKDLVFLNNGALHGQLNLPKGEIDRGPAELAVLKNLLAHHFVLAVEKAADALADGEPERAAAALERIRAIIAGVRAEIPAWRNDPELIRDQRVLENYLQVLASPEARTHRTGLSDSLRLAAWRKSHRPPPEWQS